MYKETTNSVKRSYANKKELIISILLTLLITIYFFIRLKSKTFEIDNFNTLIMLLTLGLCTMFESFRLATEKDIKLQDKGTVKEVVFSNLITLRAMLIIIIPYFILNGLFLNINIYFNYIIKIFSILIMGFSISNLLSYLLSKPITSGFDEKICKNINNIQIALRFIITVLVLVIAYTFILQLSSNKLLIIGVLMYIGSLLPKKGIN